MQGKPKTWNRVGNKSSKFLFMKTSRFILSAFAVLLGIGGALASDALVDITNHGVRQNQTEIFNTKQANVCDNDRMSGNQCTLNTTGTPLAYQVSAPSQPLYRP